MNMDKTFGFSIWVYLRSSVALFLLVLAFTPVLPAADLADRIDKLLAGSPAAEAAFWVGRSRVR